MITRGKALGLEKHNQICGNAKIPSVRLQLPKKKRISSSISPHIPERAISSFCNRAIYGPTLRVKSNVSEREGEKVNAERRTSIIVPRATASPSVILRDFSNDTSKPAVYLPKDVDISKLIFSPTARSKPSGPRIIHVNYESTTKRLRIQTPIVRAPFGVTRQKFGQERDKPVETNWLLQFALENMETNPEIKKLYDLINAIDDKIIEQAAKNGGKDWFDKEVPASVLTHNYKRAIQKKDQFSPLMKLKIPLDFDPASRQSVPRAHVWLDKTPVSLDEITKGCKVINIMELKYVWIVSGIICGTTWNLLQSKIVEKGAEKLSSYSFIEGK